jgi:cystathionine beta-lyase
LLQVARQYPNLVTALDNTWGAGLAFDAFALGLPIKGDSRGVDLTIHALTKYPSGGADVLMGAVITRDEALHLKLKMTHMRLGLGVGGNDVEAVLRGLPSMALRYAAHDATAREVAHWLAARSEVAQVLHPALPQSPGHANWAALCKSAAGLVSIALDGDRYGEAQAHAFVDALKLFKIGYSWGGPMSLVMPYGLRGMRQFGPLSGARNGTLVRFALGLEDVQDLIADLDQAFAALNT